MAEDLLKKNQAGWISRLLYGLLYGILYSISLLPFWVLYRISELFYLVVRHLFRYRMEVITSNLQRAFPEKTEKEISQFRKAFYLHLCDLFVETIKLLSIPDKQLAKRMQFENPEIIDKMRLDNTGIIMLASHYGNFEWLNVQFDKDLGDIPTNSIYQRVKSPVFEKLMQRLRTKGGTQMVEKKDALRHVIKNHKELGAFGFMADQSPSRRKKLYFTRFLNQPTAMHEGYSILAIGRNMPVYYMDVTKVSRGHYSYRAVPIDIGPFLKDKNLHGLTDMYARILEKTIQKKPSFWLWSHKRWKHKPQDGDEGIALF
ncbi:lysophospholipid acyltransferase family protein [bacterium]|nr:lysophospholipid acyltransferase family protein [bacterium]